MSGPAPTARPELPAPPAGKRGWPWRARAPLVPEPPPGGWPAITLVTPSFNQARFVEATLRSVLLQGYPALEYLVMDGGSTDGSVEILRRYEPWLTGLTSGRDGGQSQAINRGLARAGGAILGWLNSDDRLLPGALFEVARLAASRPEAVAFAGQCRSVTPGGRLVYLQRPRGADRSELADWGRAGQLSQPACLFRAEAWRAAGGLDEKLHFALDVDLWLKLAAQGPFAVAQEPWAEETLHAGAKTQAQRGRSLAEVHLVQLRHGFEELAMRRMGEELQELHDLKRRRVSQRAKDAASALLQPALEKLRARRGRG